MSVEVQIMSRLIDANELLKTGSRIEIAIPRNCHPYEAIRIQGNAFRRAVEEAPTVDAVNVSHGNWSPVYKDGYNLGVKCSECKTTWDAKTNFCPNCGAKMDKGYEYGL